MSCTVRKIKEDSMVSVKAMVQGNAKTVTFNKRGDAIFTPSAKSLTVKGRNNARAFVNKRIDKINAWSNYTFNTDAYKGQWTTINESNPNHITLELNFPKSLEKNLYNKKMKDMETAEARYVQMEDAERYGITEQEYLDDYLVDMMPETQDGFNYGLYLQKKREMRDYFSKRVDVLRAMSNKTKTDFQQISQFETIAKALSKDLKHLEGETAIVDNFFDYFANDLQIIQDIIAEDPTMDNLVAARMVVNQLQDITRYDPDQDIAEPTTFVVDKTSELAPPLKKKFDDFDSSLNAIDKILYEAEIDFLSDEGISDPRDAEKLSWIAKGVLPLGGTASATPIMKYVRKTYDDAVAKSEKYTLRQSLESIKKRIENKLKSNNQGFDIFTRVTDKGFRIAGKFNEQWDAFTEGISGQKNTIQALIFKKNKDKEDFKKIKTLRKKLFDTMDKEVEFLDVRRVPEFINHAELGEFGAFFHEQAEADNYKENLIQSLIGESGNRAVAERIYNKMVQEQLENLISFQVDMEYHMLKLMKEDNVTEYQDLSDNKKNQYLEKYYTNSPFAFSESYQNTGLSEIGKVYYVNGERFTTNDISTMEYQSFLPKNQRFTDRDFEQQIASDPDYYEAWEMFDTGTRYINRNRKYKQQYDSSLNETSLPYEMDLFKENLGPLKKLWRYVSINTKERIKTTTSTSRFKDKDTVGLASGVSSVNDKVNASIDRKSKVLKAMGYPFQAVINAHNPLSSEARTYLESLSDIPVPQVFQVQQLLEAIARKEVQGNRQDNLFEIMHAQLETVEKFKAKKEIETKLLYLKNMVEKQTNNGTTAKEKQIANGQAVIDFINTNLYGVNNRANWGGKLKQSATAGEQLFMEAEKEMIAEVDNNIQLLTDLLENMTDENLIKDTQADIEALRRFKKSKGRIISPGSIVETIMIKIPILAGLGFNLTSQVGNLFMGNLSGRQNDGLEWTSGNYIVAESYTRKWKIAKRKFSRQQKDKYALTNILIDGLGVFQNSANEIHKIIETDIKGKLPKYVSNPLYIVSDTEKMIQRPQILAKMGDIEITGKNGQIVRAFNVSDTSNPHPAFKQVDGVLSLTDEFDTEENRNTWINRTSQEYADHFGESGTIPTMISRINGDYRDSSTMGLKATTFGAMVAMFKTWLPAFIQRRYGREHGVITKLHESNRGGETTFLQGLSAAGLLAVGAGTLLSPALAIFVGASYAGYHALKKSQNEDMKFLTHVMKEMKSIMLLK